MLYQNHSFGPNLSTSIYKVEIDKVVPRYFIDIRTKEMPGLNKKTLTNKTLEDYHKRSFYSNDDFIFEFKF